MPDHLTPDQRHANMAAIRAKDTKPEMVVRKFLWSRGFRYRLNHPRLPGKPDIVLRKYRTCIFVNGCFWHGHKIVHSAECIVHSFSADALGARAGAECIVHSCDGEMPELVSSECCKIPKTNREFWVRKITRNMERDREVQHQLAKMGWHCITLWECQLKSSCRQQTLEGLAYTLSKIFLADHKPRRYVIEEPAPLMVAEESADYGGQDR